MRTVWVLATIALGLIPAVARQAPDVRTPSLGPRGGERKTGWQRTARRAVDRGVKTEVGEKKEADRLLDGAEVTQVAHVSPQSSGSEVR